MLPLSFRYSVTDVGGVQKTCWVMKKEIAKYRRFGRLVLEIFSLASLTGMLLLPVEAKADQLCLQMTNCVPLITCTGTPHETYCIETTTCLTAPVKWVPL